MTPASRLLRPENHSQAAALGRPGVGRLVTARKDERRASGCGLVARRIGGFTLVEILVVVVILAIAASVAVVAFDDGDRDRTAREARRFADALEHAAARAQVRAETLGASADGGAWRFWRRDAAGQWQPVADDDVLAAHALPSGLNATALTYGGVQLEGDAIVPLRPTGRNEPFAFALAGREARLVLTGDPLNRVSIAPVAP
ncbi:MAG: prepilin-type N-terminal cleavage/methylation domain-containing protein [Burkholderiales bacterium]